MKKLKTPAFAFASLFVFAPASASADQTLRTGPPSEGTTVPAPAPNRPTVSVLPGATLNPVYAGSMTPRERVWTWDMNLDGAVGRLFPDTAPSRWTGFGRVRVGVLHIHDSFYFSLGPTYEISDLRPATFGLQGEMMHIETGLWCQAGALLDTSPHAGFMAAAGWSLFGVEVQGREYDKNNYGFSPSVYGKIRLPIGIIARVFAK